MDVYLKDSGKIMDVEMQSYPQADLPLRTRYYQSMIDADNLLKGQGDEDLKASYIVFICTDDPFHDERGKKYGLPCYTLTTKCHEAQELNFNDKIKKVIYNASGWKILSKVKGSRRHTRLWVYGKWTYAGMNARLLLWRLP